MRVLVTMLFVLLFSCSSKKDYKKELESLDHNHQVCLDNGDQMLTCSQHYYLQLDSMTNLIYADLLNRASNEQKEQLMKDHNEWLKKKEMEFKKFNISNSEDFVFQDDLMFIYEVKADFLYERAMKLIEMY